ncbi:MAG: hypothetical protein JHC33_01275 [Ignisphaera sp.]|nr:hypothetical protein [Ignisphaera sp.]
MTSKEIKDWKDVEGPITNYEKMSHYQIYSLGSDWKDKLEGNNTSVKQDSGKLRYDLMPFDALDYVAKVLTYGIKKYPNPVENWRMNSVKADISRYKAALLRHYSAMAQGEILDPESGLPHMAHIATNSLFILALEKKFGVYNV